MFVRDGIPYFVRPDEDVPTQKVGDGIPYSLRPGVDGPTQNVMIADSADTDVNSVEHSRIVINPAIQDSSLYGVDTESSSTSLVVEDLPSVDDLVRRWINVRSDDKDAELRVNRSSDAQVVLG
jgi:hypothetical protein